MESSVDTTTTTTTTNTLFNNLNTPISSASPSPTSSPPPLPSLQPPVVMSPCAACKILRRKCAENCVLAPYFPPTEPHKFTTAHRVFGASNIIKFLQELPESQRADAVSSMVYEANARIRDPVYGCAGAICQLQKQVGELQAQLARAQAELINMQTQQANLVALIYMEMAGANSEQQQYCCPPQPLNNTVDIASPHIEFSETEYGIFLEDNSHFGSLWGSEPLWT